MKNSSLWTHIRWLFLFEIDLHFFLSVPLVIFLHWLAKSFTLRMVLQNAAQMGDKYFHMYLESNMAFQTRKIMAIYMR